MNTLVNEMDECEDPKRLMQIASELRKRNYCVEAAWAESKAHKLTADQEYDRLTKKPHSWRECFKDFGR